MILRALYDFYEAFQASQEEGAAVPAGMQWKEIPIVITISKEGKFVSIEDTRDNNKAREFQLAKSVIRTCSVVPNILWDHEGYVLGLPAGSSPSQETADKQLNAFIELIDCLTDKFPDNVGLSALREFYHTEEYKKVPVNLFQDSKNSTTNITFVLEGSDAREAIGSNERLVHYINNELNAQESKSARCLVTGEVAAIAEKHRPIKYPGTDKPPVLISYNKPPFEFYNKKQGGNAPISKKASDAIVDALNVLLEKGASTNYKLGDTTFLFWSTLKDSEIETEERGDTGFSLESLISSYKEATFNGAFGLEDYCLDEEIVLETETPKKSEKKSKPLPDPTLESERVLRALKVATNAKEGRIAWQNRERFYLLGLTPNAKRVSVKLWMEGTVAEIVGNTIQHLKDLNIVSFANPHPDKERPTLRSVYSLVRAVSSSKEADKWSPVLIQGIVESIVKGQPYPQALQMACLDRVLHDSRTKYPVTEVRAAILKAYINRKYKQPILDMALDFNNTHPAYVAGRAFALLERIQKQANPEVNASITDRYYRMASSTPNMVFGRLLQLTNHHLTKVKRDKGGLGYYFERKLGEVLNLLPGGANAIPSRFTPDEQSIFAVGYYHQKSHRDEKTEKEAEQEKVPQEETSF